MSKPFKLPRPFAEKWLEALRGGEFHQTKDQLVTWHDHMDSVVDTKYANEYCCLGVAIAMYGFPPTLMAGNELPRDICGVDNFPKEIPEILLEGIEESIVEILTKLNDGMNRTDMLDKMKLIPGLQFPYMPDGSSSDLSREYSFKQIAEFIELNCEFIDEE